MHEEHQHRPPPEWFRRDAERNAAATRVRARADAALSAAERAEQAMRLSEFASQVAEAGRRARASA